MDLSLLHLKMKDCDQDQIVMKPAVAEIWREWDNVL